MKPENRAIRYLCTTLLLTAFFWANSVYALSMGDMTVESKLDEPFSAVIKLNNVSDAEFSTLNPKLAPSSDFARANITQLPYLKNLRFEAVRASDKQAQIKITSEKPVSEPYVQFLVALEWSGGKLLHEYTALLSPQEYASQTDAITAPSVTETPTTAGDSVVTQTNQQSEIQVSAAVNSSSDELVFSDNEYGPVKRGESLWAITSQIDRPASVSLSDMMAAIVEANPQAFQDGNPDVLLLGSVLSIPDGASVSETVSESTAVAGTDATTAGNIVVKPVVSTQTSDTSENISQTSESDSSGGAASTQEEPLLRIIGADIREYSAQDRISAEQIVTARQEFDPNNISDAVQSLQTRIAILEESILARDLENQELRERMRFLEDKFDRAARVLEEFENAAKVLEFEQSDFALLQNQELAEVEVLGLNSDPVATVEQQQNLAAIDSAVVPTGSDVDALVEGATHGVVDKSVVTEEEPTARVTATTNTWWQRLSKNLAFDEQAKKLTLIGVILASLLGLFAVRRRRKADEVQFEKMAAATVETNEQNSTLSANSLTLATGKIERNIDPIAEAKVYIAYGRQEEAEQVLKDALAKNPDQPELAIELLDTYRHGNDVRGFAEYAANLKTRWPMSHPEYWQRVVEMGRKYLPGHELFEDDGLGDVGEDLGAELSSLAETSDQGDAQQSAVAFSNGEKQNPYLAIDNISNTTDGNGANSSDARGGNGSSHDSGEFDESSVQWDGVGTKINLAKAYIDMGDIENAKDLIEQAMREGSDQQREQASELATQLAANLHS